ncbi:MAG: hypothetical protein BWK73_06540 [Thiothrix lacustris]|uniref:Serine protease n=1 Tax=Thiothrix lacustris TaxID=525917 RepID=A0A1Y1QWN7_9GAMM|nr:MAG: hypothetical protein BWK73_06540 [Thiothrix lacustris]
MTDIYSQSYKQWLGAALLVTLITPTLSGCNGGGSATTQDNANAVTTIPTVAAAAVSTATTVAAATVVAATAAAAPSVNAPAIAATAVSSATSGQRFNLVSSSGKVVDSSTLNQTKTVSVGSSGASGRPEALGANTTPLTDAELAAIKTTTPTAAARIINESVIGFDSRFHVNPYAYPQRAVSLITYNGSTHCTGWLVSADTLVTAGHCVHGGGTKNRWGTPSAFKIYPGFSDGYAPYGYCQPRELYSSYGWITNADGEADVGVIKLDCAIGKSIGYFSYFVAEQTDNTAITINGYPGDKADGNEQWGSTGVISRSTPTKVYYDNDTTGGMSGSPVWLQHNNTAWSLGIHTNGESLLSPGTNSGTRISQDVFDLITAVKELP